MYCQDGAGTNNVYVPLYGDHATYVRGCGHATHEKHFENGSKTRTTHIYTQDMKHRAAPAAGLPLTRSVTSYVRVDHLGGHGVVDEGEIIHDAVAAYVLEAPKRSRRTGRRTLRR